MFLYLPVSRDGGIVHIHPCLCFRYYISFRRINSIKGIAKRKSSCIMSLYPLKNKNMLDIEALPSPSRLLRTGLLTLIPVIEVCKAPAAEPTSDDPAHVLMPGVEVCQIAAEPSLDDPAYVPVRKRFENIPTEELFRQLYKGSEGIGNF
jgi:hypothetical protein